MPTHKKDFSVKLMRHVLGVNHSPISSRYTSEAYRVLLVTKQIHVNMRRTGNYSDNAAKESSHANLKG